MQTDVTELKIGDIVSEGRDYGIVERIQTFPSGTIEVVFSTVITGFEYEKLEFIQYTRTWQPGMVVDVVKKKERLAMAVINASRTLDWMNYPLNHMESKTDG